MWICVVTGHNEHSYHGSVLFVSYCAAAGITQEVPLQVCFLSIYQHHIPFWRTGRADATPGRVDGLTTPGRWDATPVRAEDATGATPSRWDAATPSRWDATPARGLLVFLAYH